MHPTKKVLILGGGFGGVKAGLELSQNPSFDVCLMSDNPNFEYHAVLYRVATGGDRQAAAIPLKEIFAGRKIKLVRDSAKTIDRAAKRVAGEKGRYPYDYLVVAVGSVTNYFGIKGLAEHAFGIKNLAEADRLRQHIHGQLVDQKAPDLNYVVVGGGATGVELAGAIAGYVKHVMRSHGLADQAVNIDLVEAADRLMPSMPPRYSKAVAKRLRRLGVKVMTGQKVEAETTDALMVNGQPIRSHSVAWTAGITNHPFFKGNDFRLNDRGKVIVNQFLEAEPSIFVIGDNADTKYSGMAQTALRDAVFVARHLSKLESGQPLVAYEPEKPVYVTPVGPGWAAVWWGGWQTFGRLGRIVRSLADFAAYRELQPWWKASRHWADSLQAGHSCPECSK